MHKIIRRNEVRDRTGLPLSTMYLKIKVGEFPKPIQLTARNVGWLESEIEAWLASRVEARDREAV